MAKLLKSILGNAKKLEGVKSSTTKPLDLGGYTPKSGDEEQKFVKKHEVEKFADRAGNDENAYVATTKEAPYKKQNPAVYEDIMSDPEGSRSSLGPIGSVPGSVSISSPRKSKKKTNEEKVVGILGYLSENDVPFKFLNGEKVTIAPEAARSVLEVFNSLTEENKKKFIGIAFNSLEDFNGIAKLKG